MNNDDYKEALFYAASIFNERLGAEFSEDNLVLRCFQTENQQEVFEQFCKQYFPDRLEDRYTEDGYFDFHASAFVGKEDGVDGIIIPNDEEGAALALFRLLKDDARLESLSAECRRRDYGNRNEILKLEALI